MGANSLPKTVARQRRDCDLNPGPAAPESSTLTTRLPSHTSYLCQISVHVICGCGSVLLWPRRDKLCISSFMDDVILAPKPRQLIVAAQLKHSPHAASSMAINGAKEYPLRASGLTGLLFGHRKGRVEYS